GDSTAGIQKALNDCASYGGGTVFLPDGTYLVTRTITIPPRVTLRGDWQDPDLGKEGYGTVIHVWMPPEDTNQGGLFLLSGSSGVVGMTVYYPHQSLENVKAYPPVFYTNGRGVNYMLSTVKDCTVINGYRGIGACCDFQNPNAHEQFTVENVKGTFLYTAAEMYNQADVGTWENVVVSNRYWADVNDPDMTPASANQLDEYTRANTVGMKLGDLEWTEFVGLQIEDCKIGLEIVNGQRIHFAGSLYGISITGCGIGIQIDDLDDRWGMVIAQSTIQNGIINNTDGLVKLWNVALSGGSKGQITLAKDEEVTLSLPTDRSYVKPNANTTVARLTRNGIMDISAALQEILDKIGETGGVVYLPSGTYRLDAPIIVPAGVELRGSNAVATRGFGENNQGTVLLSYYGDGEAFDPMKDAALITLAGENAGLSGIRITYPQNGPYDENLNTTYAVRGTASGVYVVNCCITAAGYGIDFTGCDDHCIKKVTTCCYYNTYRLGGKNGLITGCLQNGTVITRCSDRYLKNWLAEADIFPHLFDPILRKETRYIIVDGAEDQVIYNTFAYGCHTMITAQNSVDTLAVNIGCDNIGADGYQTHVSGGTMTVLNAMRYNGKSYKVENDGSLGLYNRLTINNKNEPNGAF
ncbi:MAG: hypothetical protein IKM39_01025, partial [Clostridia bacterium]|nr:hypothetical protein [Clostridia bacterium]